MNLDFKWRHFQGQIILGAVRWYCKYGIRYRELVEMMAEHGVRLDHSTVYRGVQRYAPEIEQRVRWAWHRPGFRGQWHVDETYIKVKGQWVYLYRAVTEPGDTIDFYLSETRSTNAAKRFLGKMLRGFKPDQRPIVLRACLKSFKRAPGDSV